ncbi:uncharacterized [Tachysurus ichikawai]
MVQNNTLAFFLLLSSAHVTSYLAALWGKRATDDESSCLTGRSRCKGYPGMGASGSAVKMCSPGSPWRTSRHSTTRQRLTCSCTKKLGLERLQHKNIILEDALQRKGQEPTYTNRQTNTCTDCFTGRTQESKNLEKACMKTQEGMNRENHCGKKSESESTPSLFREGNHSMIG